ncbi:hypothetical protein [Phenylobacterium aquaticum]|jgi:hypothetical protein|uniref:hypothetical protein n=1 Tax=Phenylobacterium aquaticum TaxID=1763816 RepID=UPI001F5D6B61|nr:hypothetical protein [Phenylobacterium aquaticum]MCI3131223.1 hypothetical protein [Phenylobacterium aquaticum]
MFKLPSSRDVALWGSASLVFLVSMIAGHFAAQGMNLIQWLGAATSVLGSITVAVAVRVWGPEEA